MAEQKEKTVDVLIKQFENKFDRERRATKECLADICQLLSHDTSCTRRQLIRVLEERVSIIKGEIEIDVFSDDLSPSE